MLIAQQNHIYPHVWSTVLQRGISGDRFGEWWAALEKECLHHVSTEVSPTVSCLLQTAEDKSISFFQKQPHVSLWCSSRYLYINEVFFLTTSRQKIYAHMAYDAILSCQNGQWQQVEWHGELLVACHLFPCPIFYIQMDIGIEQSSKHLL